MDIIFLLEWITFAFSLSLLHPRNDRAARLLIAVMVITVVAESAGYYYRAVLHRTNHPIYNISVPAIIIVFLFLFRNGMQKQIHRRAIILIIFLFFSLVLTNLLAIQGLSKFATYNYIAGTLSLMLASVYYFRELIKRPEYISVSREPIFWIVAATLALYIPKAILYAVFEYLAYTRGVMDSFGATFHLLNQFLSVIFFGLLIYGSICRLIYRK